MPQNYRKSNSPSTIAPAYTGVSGSYAHVFFHSEVRSSVRPGARTRTHTEYSIQNSQVPPSAFSTKVDHRFVKCTDHLSTPSGVRVSRLTVSVSVVKGDALSTHSFCSSNLVCPSHGEDLAFATIDAMWHPQNDTHAFSQRSRPRRLYAF